MKLHKRGGTLKQHFLNSSLNFILASDKNITEEKKEKLLYGLEGLYLTITKLIIINIIALVLGIWQEFIISLILFNILRFPGFGFHANNSFTCLLTSTIIIVGMPFLLIHITIPTIGKAILAALAVLAFIIYAPADTVKRPLTNKRKRIIRKIVASILAIIYAIIIILLPNDKISSLFLSGLLIETIFILPITYKIFKMPYANYKKI